MATLPPPNNVLEVLLINCKSLLISLTILVKNSDWPSKTLHYINYSSSWSKSWLWRSDIFIPHDFHPCFRSNIPQIWHEKVIVVPTFGLKFVKLCLVCLDQNWTVCTLYYRFIKLLSWLMAIVQSLLIIAARKHYTVDVVVAWYGTFHFTYQLFGRRVSFKPLLSSQVHR